MSKQKNNVSDLLAAIQRQPMQATSAKSETEIISPNVTEPDHAESRGAQKTVARDKKLKSRIGKPVQFWMHDDDRKLVREFAAWLAGQGLRTTDSLVIRAVLRQAKTGSGLIEAYWDAARLDGRLKRD